jgi:hypothetical protein
MVEKCKIGEDKERTNKQTNNLTNKKQFRGKHKASVCNDQGKEKTKLDIN